MKLVTWSLATFHATVFVLATLLFAYSRGAVGPALSGLNTFVGLGLFVALWATTYFTTARALRGLDLVGSARDSAGYGRRAFRWGAANGMAFVAVLGLVAIAAATTARPGEVGSGSLFPALLFIAPLALLVSAAVGGVVGVLFGLIDLGLFTLADLFRANAKPTA